LEGLVRHRDRRRRRERVLAAVTALLIAAVGTTSAVLAFDNTTPDSVAQVPPGPVIVPDDFFALWPEYQADDAAAAQQLVDAGQDLWRLSAEATAQAFAREVLGWTDPQTPECWWSNSATGEFGSCRDLEKDPNRRQLQLSQGGEDIPWGLVKMGRITRPGERGIWSVLSVSTGGRLSLYQKPGGTRYPGALVEVTHPRYPKYVPNSVGLIYLRDCGPQNQPLERQRVDGIDRLVIPPIEPEPCPGQDNPPVRIPAILYALRTEGSTPSFHGPDLFAEFGDPGLMEVTGMGMVPVLLVASRDIPADDGLECPSDLRTSVIYDRAGPERGDPEEIVRRDLGSKILATDQMQRTDNGDRVELRLIRSGRPIAFFDLHGNDTDGWWFGGYTACADF
jgi:hypothetical protein